MMRLKRLGILKDLLFSDRLEVEKSQRLLDTYGTENKTDIIAANIHMKGLSINLEIFNTAWECLAESV